MLTLEWFRATMQQACLISLGIFLFLAASIYLSSFWGAPWVITSRETVRKMLKLAEVQEGEVVYDLGAGDGRIIIMAAQEFKAKAIGIEIDPIRWLLAKISIWRRQLNHTVKIRWGNFFTEDLHDADVVTLYLTRETNLKLSEHLENNLTPGTRIVSNAFTIPGWTPAKIDNRNLLFMYIIGQTGESTQTRFVEYD